MDLASLAIKIDTTDVNNAITQLNNLAQAAKKVDESFSGIEGKSKSYIQSIVQQANSINNLTQSIDKNVDSAKKSASLYENMVAKLTMTKEAYQAYTLSLKGLDEQQVSHITKLERSKSAEEGLTAALKEHSATVRKATSDYNDMVNKLTMSKEAYEALKLFQSGWNAEQIKTIQRIENINSAHTEALKINVQYKKSIDDLANSQAKLNAMSIAQRMGSSQNIPVQSSQVRGDIASVMTMSGQLAATQALTSSTIALGQSVQQTRSHYDELHRILGKTHDMLIRMAAYRVINIIGSLPADILDVNVRMESLRVQLEGITGSAGQAKIVFKELLALDFKTPFDIEGLAQTWIRLKNYGLEPTRDVMKSLTDGVARLGGGTDILNRVSLQLGQAWAKNKLQLQDMKPMMDAGIPVLQILADKMHTSAGAILEMSRAGTIGHKEIMLLLKGIEEWAPDAALRAMDTLKGQISNVKSAWIQFQDALLESKGESRLKDMFDGISNSLRYWTKALQENEGASAPWLDKQKEVNEGIKARKLLEEHPIMAKVAGATLMGSTIFGIDSSKLLWGYSEAQLQVAKNELEMSKASDLAKKAIEAKNFSVKKDLELTEQSEKATAAQVKALESLESVNKSIMEVENARIDAKIKTVGILSGLTVKQYENEYKKNQDAFKNQELSQTVYLDKQMQLIEAIKNAKLKAIDEESILIKSKTNEQIDNVQKALEVIHTIESGNGRPGQEVNRTSVNMDNWTLGAGQAKISTLRDPGVKGMLPYGDMESIDKIKGNYDALVEYVKTHQADLTAWSDKYFTQLVVKYGSVIGALKQYGAGTESYNKNFISMYNDHIGLTKQQISLDQAQMEKELEKRKVAEEAANATLKLKTDLIEKSKEYINALEEEKIKSLELTGQVNAASQTKYTHELSKIESSNVTPALQMQMMDNAGQENINNANQSAMEYQKTLLEIQRSTRDIGVTSTDAFDVINKGFGGLTGSFTNLTTAITQSTDAILNNKIAAMETAQNQKIDIKDREKLAIEFAKKDKALEAEKVKNTLTGTRQIMGATSQLFDENTKGRKAFHTIEMMLAGIEMAMSAKKVAAELMGIFTVTSSKVTSSGTQIAADMATGAAGAVTGVVNQAQGDPYSAFPRMAAMAAIMAALGFAVGGFSGGGSKSAPPTTSPDTGTVLGDPTAKSESINNTYQLLKDIHASEYAELRGINAGVAALHDGITNVVTRLFQSGGIKDPLIDTKSKIAGIGGLVTSIGDIGDIGAKLPLIGDFIDGFQQFLFGGLFGKVTKSIVGGGIATGATPISGLIAGGDLSASQYATVETKKKSWFSSSTSYSEIYGEVDAQTQKALNGVFKSIGNTMFGLADVLGNDLTDKVNNAVIPAMKIELRGLSGEDAAKKLNGVLSATIDTMSSDIFGALLGQYQQLGEGMFDTTVRIVSEMALVKDAFHATSTTMGTDVIAISDAIVQATGGLKEFQKAFDNYIDKFFTDRQKFTRNAEQAATELLAVFTGDVIDNKLAKSRDMYREVLSAIDTNTESGQKQYAILISLSDAADQYYSFIEDLALKQRDMDIQIMELQGKSLDALTAKRKDELAAMDETLRLSQSIIYAYTDINAQISDATSGLSASMSNMKSLADAIKNAIGSTVIESDALTRQKREKAQDLIKKAISEGTPIDKIAGLSDALKDISKPSSQLWKTSIEYARDQGRTAANLMKLSENADAQLSEAQKQLDAVNGTTAAVVTVKEAIDKLQVLLVEKANIVQDETAKYTVTQLKDALPGLQEAQTNAFKTYQEKSGVYTSTANARVQGTATAEQVYAALDAMNAAGRAYENAGLLVRIQENKIAYEGSKISSTEPTPLQKSLDGLTSALGGGGGSLVDAVVPAGGSVSKEEKKITLADAVYAYRESLLAMSNPLERLKDRTVDAKDETKTYKDSLIATNEILAKLQINADLENDAMSSLNMTSRMLVRSMSTMVGVLNPSKVEGTITLPDSINMIVNSAIGLSESMDKVTNKLSGKESAIIPTLGSFIGSSWGTINAMNMVSNKLAGKEDAVMPTLGHLIGSSWAMINSLNYTSNSLTGKNGAMDAIQGMRQSVNSFSDNLGSAMAPLLSEISALRKEVAQLRASSEATAKNTYSTDRTLKNVSQDGTAFSTVAA